MDSDDMPEDYASLLRLKFREIKLNGDVASAEDVASADSCLLKDSRSHSGWESVRDALLDALDSHSVSAKFERPNFLDGADTEMISSSKMTDTEMISFSNVTSIAAFLDKIADHNSSTSGEVNHINDAYLITENGNTFGSRVNLEKVFLPTNNGRQRNIGTLDSGYNSSFPAYVADDQLPADIFKVWELESLVEDDELIKQLNKALSENSLEPLYPVPVSDVTEVSNDLKEVDDLISGIADLSLIEGSI